MTSLSCTTSSLYIIRNVLKTHYRPNKTGTTAINSEATAIISQTTLLDTRTETDSLGNGIVIPGLAAEGEEVIGPAEAVLDPPPPVAPLVVELEPEPEPEDEVEGSGGAAMKISFCAPSANPYRAL